MPVLEVHLVEGLHTPSQHAELLVAMSTRYAEVTGVPRDRVRAHVTLHRPELWANGGIPADGRSAPYFTAVVFADQPAEVRRRLLGALTDLIVDVLGVDRRLVHGEAIPVQPDDWAIGGVSAAARRAYA
ncbi:MAG TPA: 4-oxalocrotonate tautomerase [Pseudonocardia sp.]|jgi:4-oxalocrotonate tautomerase|uniref:tautomerase family protein n=1 Tax=Pseudonocardia sp. TaxID=60912 RepID=UPI002B4ADDED|nr:4-oxalocrotonate tautomerase [Pseudonocardia sp.]HLU57323.1 4-oxalocrotonate tautomerase [Pseudonocardia sp.]